MHCSSLSLLLASALLYAAPLLPAQQEAPKPPVAALTPALKAEITALAAKLRDGGKAALLAMKPTGAQIERIAATPEDAKLLAAYCEALYAKLPGSGLAAQPGQTEILVPDGDLPGGYAKHAARFRPGIAIHAFKFVAPGETSGMAFDGLVKVDGAWVVIPKMWRAFDR